MISKPKASCPCCGSKITVLDVIDVSRHAETVTYYGECDCGAANITVSRGQVIGAVGNSGNSQGPHLHFEVIKNGVRVNPLNYVRP